MSKARELAALGNAYSDGALSNRNKIINGAMTIDQRNAGAAVTVTANNAAFTLDRFRVDAPTTQGVTVQKSATAPVGFISSLLFTSGTASTNAGDVPAIQQFIEGFNIADLGWGASGAKPVTISFWVRSSLTGNFGLSLRNSAGNRTYVAPFNISAANTFEYKTITIVGDTSGTWLADNGRGLVVMWDMGVGTTNSISASSAWGTSGTGLTGGVKLTQNTGATFYITGVQLEVGDTATPFEHRSYGQELALCQRYYQRSNYPVGSAFSYGLRGVAYLNRANSNWLWGQIPLACKLRVTPTITYSDNAGTIGSVYQSDGTTDTCGMIMESDGTISSFKGGAFTGDAFFAWTADAEL